MQLPTDCIIYIVIFCVYTSIRKLQIAYRKEVSFMKFVHDYMQPSVRQIPTNTKQIPFEWHSSIKKTKTSFKHKENSHLKKYVKEKGNRNSIQKSTNTKMIIP